MQRIPFSNGWALVQDPGWPAPDDDDDYVSFEEPPASPDPSTGETSCYEITSSVETSGLPTPPPSAGPPIPIDALIRAAAQRLQEDQPEAAAPDAAFDAAPAPAHADADAAPDTDRAAIATPPATPLRRSARLAERARRLQEEEAPVRPPVHPQPRRGPQRVAKMSTGGVKRN